MPPVSLLAKDVKIKHPGRHLAFDERRLKKYRSFTHEDFDCKSVAERQWYQYCHPKEQKISIDTIYQFDSLKRRN
jgi:hypothetical protein